MIKIKDWRIEGIHYSYSNKTYGNKNKILALGSTKDSGKR